MSLIDAAVVGGLLRQAPTAIRETYTPATKGPWVCLGDGDRIIRDPNATADEDDSNPCGSGPPLEYVVDEPLYANPANGDHIALFDPITAAAVQRLLEDLAVDFEARGHVHSQHLNLASIVLAATIMRKTGRGHDLLSLIPEADKNPA